MMELHRWVGAALVLWAVGSGCSALKPPCPDGSAADGACASRSLDGGIRVDASSSVCRDGGAGPVSPVTVSSFSMVVSQAAVDKVDLLFMVDNSGSMAEEQNNLARNFPVIVRSLATGDTNGDGLPEFPPVADLHVGVVSSDMGTAGFPVPTCSDDGDPDGDDGILVTRGNTTISGCAASYPKFFSFMPATDSADSFIQQFTCVALAGTGGCGFEHQLEAPLKALLPSTSATRFLSGTGHGDGENAGFQRPDSILAIVILTDEEDCSAEDAEMYNVGSTRFPGEQLNLRCFMYGSEMYGAVWPPSRYVDGFLEAVGNDPSRLVFAAITGVPPSLVPDPDNVDFDAILRAPEMQEMIDPMDPNRLRPSCNVPGLGIAFPPRRIVTVARDIAALTATPGSSGNATVQSICQADFDTALRAVTNRIGNLLRGACLPRVLSQRPDGTVGCAVREIIAGDAAGCAGAPGAPPCTTPIELPGCRVDAAGCCVGIDTTTGEVLGQLCTIPQSPAAGWFYDTSGGDCGGRACTPGDPGYCPQRVSFTQDYIPPSRAVVRLECLEQLGGSRACVADADCGPDLVCHLGACVAGACGPTPVGAFCLPPDAPEGGFSARETYAVIGHPACGEGICLVDRFDGYPELPATPEEEARLYCSCRCDGSEPGARYCACPSGFSCLPGFTEGPPGLAGSYCRRDGS